MKRFLNGFIKVLKKVFFFVFPFAENLSANRKVEKTLGKDDDFSNGIAILAEMQEKDAEIVVEKQYNESIDAKNKLEDKAKTNIVTVTISVTLIMGAYNILNTISTKYGLVWINWVSFFIFISAISFMIVAGIMSIRVLIAKNEIYKIELKSYLDKAVLRKDYLDCSSSNNKKNLIRNNMIFASYACIRNAFLCLVAVLIILAIPI